jgi:small subunit ribosomal protein S20
MANHKSSIKRIRSNNAKKVRNKYQHKTTRNAIKELRAVTSKSDATKKYNELASMLDKQAKKNVIHKNKASNLKSELAKHINTLK